MFERPLPAVGYTRSDEGCARCGRTGTTGQFTIAEFLPLEEVTRSRLTDGDGLTSLMAGRRTLRDEAVDALAAGTTDVTAVLRAHLGPAASSNDRTGVGSAP